MRQKTHVITISIMIALALLTVLGNILSNLASSQIPSVLLPYLRLAWPILGIVTLLGIVLSIFLYFQQQSIPSSLQVRKTDSLFLANQKGPSRRELSKNIGDLLYSYQGHTEEVNALCWSPDGRYIASADKEVHIWQVTTGACLAVYKGHANVVKAMKWPPNGNYIVSQDEEFIHVWEADVAKKLLDKTDRYVPRQLIKIALPVTSKQNEASLSLVPMDISPDGMRLIIGSKIYNPFTGNHIFDVGTYVETPSCVAWSPSDRDIAISWSDSNVTIFSAQTGNVIDSLQLQAIIGEIFAICWAPNGKSTAFGGAKRVIQLWSPNLLPGSSYVTGPVTNLAPIGGDRKEDEDPSRYYGHSEAIVCIAWSPNGEYLASLSKDNVLQLWKPFTRSTLYTRKGYHSNDCGPTSIAWVPDSSCIASIAEEMTIEVWKVYDTTD